MQVVRLIWGPLNYTGFTVLYKDDEALLPKSCIIKFVWSVCGSHDQYSFIWISNDLWKVSIKLQQRNKTNKNTNAQGEGGGGKDGKFHNLSLLPVAIQDTL